MSDRLESLRNKLLDKRSEQGRLEVSYRKFLTATYGQIYLGMSGDIMRRQDDKQRSDYRRAWQTVQDEIQELTWLINDFTLEK